MDSPLHHGVPSSDLDISGQRSLRIGRYELIAQLAQGGMGTVYLARIAGEAGFSRLYAAKLMHPHLASEEAFVGMFLDEARLAAGIHHSNVVSVVDLGVCERGHFVVMEYVEGCTLEQLLKRHPERSPEMVVPLVIDLLNGLHAAHTLNDDEGNLLELVHRDVSPANVLVGVDGVARITDFGIAKARSRITATRPGLLKGKVSYAAPEQLTGEPPVDARTDIFAVGVLLWYALTGERLFRGDTEAQTLRNVLQMPIPLPSTVGLHPPACFDEVCMRALERNPRDRYESAASMAEALRNVAGQNGYLASSARIGTWVQQTFERQLADRRLLLRDATSNTRLSRVTLSGLDSWPSVSVGDSSSHSSAISALRLSPGAEGADKPTPRARASWKLTAAVALAAGMGVGGLFMWWSMTREPTTVTPLAPVVTQAPEPAPPAPELPARSREHVVKPEQASAREPVLEPALEPPPVRHESTPRSSGRTSSGGAHRRHEPSGRSPTPSVSVEPPSEPAPHPSPPAAQMDSNPYMRSE